MHKHIRSTALFAAALGLASCSEIGTVMPESAATAQWSNHANGPAVRISEIHYDDEGTDAGEAIEVSAPAGTDLTGWTVVLYNGGGGAPYGVANLSSATVTTCETRQVALLAFPGIQNGDPDGMALVDAGNNVVEFLSYEGTFTASGGPANGLTSTDIGVAEGALTPDGASLQRQSASPTDWLATNEHTFGQCNDNGTVVAQPPVAVLDGPYSSIQGLPVAMSAAGSSDQDGDVLTYAWTFGDGSSATGVTVSHTYQQAGTFTVRLIVTDTGGLADTTSTTATVLTRSQALGQAIELVEQLQGRLNAGNANALVVKLEAAQKQFERDNFSGALGPLYSLLKQMAAFVRTGKLTEADAAELQELVGKVIASTQ
jgi:chitodextrinase